MSVMGIFVMIGIIGVPVVLGIVAMLIIKAGKEEQLQDTELKDVENTAQYMRNNSIVNGNNNMNM